MVQWTVSSLKPWLAPVSQDRLRIYESRAIEFLCWAFPAARQAVAPGDQIDFVRRAYRQAHRRGIRAEADHFLYLNVAFHWGIGFENDPQYRPFLHAAEWIDDAGAAVAPVGIRQLLPQLYRWEAALREDGRDTSRLLQLFAQIYRDPRPAYGRDEVLAFLHALAPRRFRLTGPDDWDAMARAVGISAAPLALPQTDMLMLTGVAVFLGQDLLNDSRFAPAAHALSDLSQPAAARRLAFGDHLIEFWRNCDARSGDDGMTADG